MQTHCSILPCSGYDSLTTGLWLSQPVPQPEFQKLWHRRIYVNLSKFVGLINLAGWANGTHKNSGNQTICLRAAPDLGETCGECACNTANRENLESWSAWMHLAVKWSFANSMHVFRWFHRFAALLRLCSFRGWIIESTNGWASVRWTFRINLNTWLRYSSHHINMLGPFNQIFALCGRKFQT